LKNKLQGFYEHKIESYRLVIRILSYNSKTSEFSWVRSKSNATVRRWISSIFCHSEILLLLSGDMCGRRRVYIKSFKKQQKEEENTIIR
jgi:hypothetical protein